MECDITEHVICGCGCVGVCVFSGGDLIYQQYLHPQQAVCSAGRCKRAGSMDRFMESGYCQNTQTLFSPLCGLCIVCIWVWRLPSHNTNKSTVFSGL